MSFLRFVVPLALISIVGCGPSTETVTPVETTPKDEVATALKRMIDSDQPASEISSVMQAIEMGKESDPAIAALEEDANKLMEVMSMNPGGVKTQAEAMLSKLQRGAAPSGSTE